MRRLARARHLAGKEVGVGGGGESNYEVLPTYTRECDRESVAAAAEASFGAVHGEYAWLRLYFQDVVAPWARLNDERLVAAVCSERLLTVDGASPPGKEAWVAAAAARGAEFCRR